MSICLYYPSSTFTRTPAFWRFLSISAASVNMASFWAASLYIIGMMTQHRKISTVRKLKVFPRLISQIPPGSERPQLYEKLHEKFQKYIPSDHQGTRPWCFKYPLSPVHENWVQTNLQIVWLHVIVNCRPLNWSEMIMANQQKCWNVQRQTRVFVFVG